MTLFVLRRLPVGFRWLKCDDRTYRDHDRDRVHNQPDVAIGRRVKERIVDHSHDTEPPCPADLSFLIGLKGKVRKTDAANPAQNEGVLIEIARPKCEQGQRGDYDRLGNPDWL